jgi:GT2 family glycosyltransferase
MIFIVIPVFNRKIFTRACLESLFKQTYSDYRIIVIDHGSTDGTSAMIRLEFPNVILIEGNSSMWWSAATNEGIKKVFELSDATTDFILTLNNDLIVNEDYLECLLQVTRTKEKVLVGSTCVDILDENKIIFAGINWSKWSAKYKPTININERYSVIKSHTNSVKSDLLPGRGMLIPLTAFKELGMFDCKNFPHYAADEDFSLRCKNAGYELMVAIHACVKTYSANNGLTRVPAALTLQEFIRSLKSIKSPNNLSKRWIWAKKHSNYPFVYFLIDFCRITFSFFKRINIPVKNS